MFHYTRNRSSGKEGIRVVSLRKTKIKFILKENFISTDKWISTGRVRVCRCERSASKWGSSKYVSHLLKPQEKSSNSLTLRQSDFFCNADFLTYKNFCSLFRYLPPRHNPPRRWYFIPYCIVFCFPAWFLFLFFSRNLHSRAAARRSKKRPHELRRSSADLYSASLSAANKK